MVAERKSMVFYCENCNTKSVTNRCNKCGRKNLREIKDDDFCFFCQMDSLSAENLKNKLDSENIGCALIPYGTGLRTALGMNLENYLVFVEYRALNYVENLFLQESSRKTEMLKCEIVDNIDKLNIRPQDEKKLAKRLKLEQSQSVVELCKNVILTATSVIDAGTVIDGEFRDDCEVKDNLISPHYYRVANDKYEVGFYTPSYRVCKISKL